MTIQRQGALEYFNDCYKGGGGVAGGGGAIVDDYLWLWNILITIPR